MVNSQEFIEGAIAEIKREVGNHRAIIALSGGVDSSVCAALAHQALGANLYPVYVDTGLMRKGETENIKQAFRHMPLTIIDATARFINALDGVADPEEKRKVTGETFIRIFEEVARQKQVEYLLQGTIYPDIIESEGQIKSHHNVGGLPSEIAFHGVVEPLKYLYKDEVREIARALKLPSELSERMPFPGPGLAVRIIGEVTEEKLHVIREANAIVEQEILRYKPWQTFAALLEKGTGVKGDVRVHGWIIAVRAVQSRDGMTADVLEMSYDVLRRIASRITSEIPDVTRVVYDITPKPPATIEFE
jgi:GMP synthase (glutamine-hydrolysing)